MGRAAVLAAVGLSLLACASGPSAHGERDLPQIALQRGGRWTTLAVRPPYIIGNTSNFVIRNGVISGTIRGSAMRVAVEDTGADGFGPGGMVALDFDDRDNTLDVGGMWNGGRVHLAFAPASLAGTVGQRFGHPANPFDVRNVEVSCQYVLDRLGPDGALTGMSMCGGMPESTRLEVPRLIQASLTRPELVVILVALLSAPPTSGWETIPSNGYVE